MGITTISVSQRIGVPALDDRQATLASPVRNYDVSRLKPALRLLPIRILFAIEMTG